MIQIFTDGASRRNPGPGGYGTILKYKQFEKELTAGFRKTTNNRMELMAVIAGLEALKTENIPVTIYSDSKYVVDAVEKKWVFGWQKKGFSGKANADLWTKFLSLYRKYNIKFVWVKGHAGHPENERCDQLAVASALSPNLLIDHGYEAAEKLIK